MCKISFYKGRTMKGKILKKEKMIEFFEVLSKDYNLLVPVPRGRIVNFAPFSAEREVLFDFYNSKRTPKEFLFPQSETLLSFYREERGVEVSASEQPSKVRVIFGIRPCDAQSLSLLDNVFITTKYQDPYYRGKRQNTIIVGMGCNYPQISCFCTSVGGDPFGEEGLDLLFVDLGDRYLFLPLTLRGEEIMGKLKEGKEAQEKDFQLFEEAHQRSRERIRSQVKVEGVPEKLNHLFEHNFWDKVHEKCLGCGICTYLCPTCHCFDLVDEAVNSSGRRIRNWDSCMFPLFTLHASGHNPRPTNKERMRQRIMHKFNYTVKNFGKIFCVGCGRCVRECPVNLDIRKVVNDLEKINELPA